VLGEETIVKFRRLLVCAGAAILTASVLTGPAYAAEPAATDTGRDPTASAIRAYQTVYPKMSDDAAKLAATQQETRKELHNQLDKNSDVYGGGWFDPPSGITHVALTNEAAAARAEQFGKELGLTVQTHVVSRSFTELARLADTLRAGTDELGKLANGQVGIDVTSNVVTVALSEQDMNSLPPGAVPDWVKLVPASTDPTEEDVCTARNNCNDSLRAGLVISRPGAGCSLGFSTHSGATRWALTAGHCGSGATSTWSTAGTVIGSLSTANSIDSGSVDASAIQVTNAGYAADGVGRIYISGGSWVGVKGWAHTLSFIWVGETVCLSARYAAPTTFGNPCAVVTNTSDPTNRGLVRVEGYDSCPGDSGGGWYWLPSSGNRYAYGLHSRSTLGCNTNPAVSWFSATSQYWTGLTYDLG
jgi:streptogrisin C